MTISNLQERRCSRSVFGEYRASQCRNGAKVERDGKPYCLVHDPERIKAKEAERAKRYAAENQVSATGYALNRAESQLVESVMVAMLGSLPSSVYAERQLVEAARNAHAAALAARSSLGEER